ncbi:MAG: alpha/beta fold hydrolase [Halioglobus sp.]
MPVNIHTTVVGEGAPVVLIHGLFGMGSNLGALARALSDGYRVYSVDLPNHGRSGWLDSADIPAMADALFAWMDHQGLATAALVGHSLGGKVAMAMALGNPGRVSSLVVADIAPVAYPPGHRGEFAALSAVAESHCASRAEAGELMRLHIEEEMVVQFLLKNLTRNDDGVFNWRFNLPGIMASYDLIRAAVPLAPAYTGPVLFIKGGDSNYVSAAHTEEILALFPSVSLKVMPGCGHWLHAQQPQLFNRLVRRFLDH